MRITQLHNLKGINFPFFLEGGIMAKEKEIKDDKIEMIDESGVISVFTTAEKISEYEKYGYKVKQNGGK